MALPAVLEVQSTLVDYWASRDVNVTSMIDVLANGSAQAPQGARYPAADGAMQSTLNDVFLGTVDPRVGLAAAQDQANAAMRGGDG